MRTPHECCALTVLFRARRHEGCFEGGMKTLRLGLSLVVGLGCLVGAGCDDDRGVVDIGSGGSDVGQPGGAAGETTSTGGAGAEATAGGGGAAAGEGGAAAGAGGAAAGAGGDGGAAECPADIFGAEGKACTPQGMICSDGGGDPCQFGQSIICVSGKWQHQEAFPAPCGGAGGQASGGAGGAR